MASGTLDRGQYTLNILNMFHILVTMSVFMVIVVILCNLVLFLAGMSVQAV